MNARKTNMEALIAGQGATARAEVNGRPAPGPGAGEIAPPPEAAPQQQPAPGGLARKQENGRRQPAPADPQTTQVWLAGVNTAARGAASKRDKYRAAVAAVEDLVYQAMNAGVSQDLLRMKLAENGLVVDAKTGEVG